MSVPTVSILMPVYNARPFLAAAIESMLRQTFTDFEFVIIDDGSTDGSREILHEYARRDRRILVDSRPNRGLVATLNEGLTKVHGEFLVRMDGDDLSVPYRIERQIEYLRAHPEVAAVGCSMRTIDGEGLPVGEFSHPAAHEQIDAAHLDAHGGAQPHAASAFRTHALRQIGGYREEFRHAEDVDLFLRLAEVGRLANLPDVLYDYRQHLGSVSHRHASAQHAATLAAAQSARARRGMPVLQIQPNVHHERVRAWRIRAKWAWWALGAGNLVAARKYAWGAFVRRPWDLSLWRLAFCAVRGR